MISEAKLLPIAEVRELSRVSPARALLQVVVEWGWVALILVEASTWTHPALIPLWIVLIGTRMHALAVLMHDAAHGRLLPNRRWNDLVGAVLLGAPVLMDLGAYRRNHLAHHRHLQTPQDPDWLEMLGHSDYWFPKKQSAVLRDMLAYGLGLRIPRLIAMFRFYAKHDARVRAARPSDERADGWETFLGVARDAVWLVALAAIVYFRAWKPFLLFWVVPFLTVFSMAVHVRAIAEHFPAESGGPESLPTSRSLRFNLLERVLLAPNHVGYHLEHHLYPSVPFHRLPELHRRLVQVPEFAARAHITRGFWGVVRECEQSRPVLELWQRQQAAAGAETASPDRDGTAAPVPNR